MSECKMYGIIGNTYHDFTMYLAGILQNMGYHILIVDSSTDLSVLKCVPDFNKEVKVINYKGIDFTSGVNDKLLYENYEIVFIVSNVDSDLNQFELQELFILTDLQRSHVENIKNLSKRRRGKIILILRDFCNLRINEDYISDYIKDKIGSVKKFFKIKLDLIDYGYRITMEYENYKDFRNISPDFRECLLSSASIITSVSPRELKGHYKRAERGKFIACSILE